MARKKKDEDIAEEFDEDKGYTRKSKPDYDSDDDELVEVDYIEEMKRVVSVTMFAVGILITLIILIKGSAGWSYMHNVLWGVFGWSVFSVPVILMYISVLMGLDKKKDEIIGKTLWGSVWAVLISSAIQIFAVGTIPGSDFLSYIISLYTDGAKFRGGGVVSLPIAGLLFVIFGKMGARIVIILIGLVLALLFSGKGIVDVFDAVISPFEPLKKLFYNEDYEDEEEDDEDDDTEESESDDTEETVEEVAEPIQNFYTPLPEIHMAEEKRVLTEEEEFSLLFDIPLPDENRPETEKTFFADYTAPKNESIVTQQERNVSHDAFDDLEMLINNATKKKEKPKIFVEKQSEPVKEYVQQTLYVLPSIELLTPSDNKFNSEEAKAEMLEKADTIVKTFDSFSVKVEIVDIFRGPSITRYEVKPGSGIKVSKIRGLGDDIALSLAAQGVRIEAPVPGKAAVGIEVPNINKDTVMLREILESEEFRTAKSKLAFAVGKDIAGNAIVGDITKMPHIIIAGTTGSGKSVCTRSIIMSILYNAKPDEVKIILIDPKVVEFKVFEGIPHLLIPIVTEAKKAAGALNWAVNEMMRRYNKFAEIGANDLKSYNELIEYDENLDFMPQIVIFIDELADMMLVAGKEVEDSICRLAQMGRAAGMHLVVATQRPTTDVITGLIKANIPSRIALSVMSQVDSRTIIDMAGADKLLGNGDMLYMPIGMSKPVRIQGCFASSKDIANTLDFIRGQAESNYNPQIIEAVESFVPQTKGSKGGDVSASGFESGSDEDFIIRGAEVAVNAGQLSTTMLQKKLKLGYARASRIVDELEERGIVGPSEGAKPRKVLMSKMQFDEWKMRQLEGK
ncbi:MAG: DNA translocase FtsK [Ruminococcus sp.]|nr:DNA translocase FtsK [Ruminococcus sp.]